MSQPRNTVLTGDFKALPPQTLYRARPKTTGEVNSRNGNSPLRVLINPRRISSHNVRGVAGSVWCNPVVLPHPGKLAMVLANNAARAIKGLRQKLQVRMKVPADAVPWFCPSTMRAGSANSPNGLNRTTDAARNAARKLQCQTLSGRALTRRRTIWRTAKQPEIVQRAFPEEPSGCKKQPPETVQENTRQCRQLLRCKSVAGPATAKQS